MLRVIVWLVFCSMFFATSSYAAKCTDKYGRAGECLSATVDGGVRVDGVFYARRPLDGSYVLRFEVGTGLVVFNVSGRPREATLTSVQFVQAVDILIAQIRKKGKDVDKIQVDLRLVDDVWSDARGAVRSAVLEGKGALDSKDVPATVALRRSISKSQTVRAVCAMVRRHKKVCSSRDSYVESIAFQQGHFPFDRKRVAAASDVGIHKETGFSISLNND